MASLQEVDGVQLSVVSTIVSIYGLVERAAADEAEDAVGVLRYEDEWVAGRGEERSLGLLTPMHLECVDRVLRNDARIRGSPAFHMHGGDGESVSGEAWRMENGMPCIGPRVSISRAGGMKRRGRRMRKEPRVYHSAQGAHLFTAAGKTTIRAAQRQPAKAKMALTAVVFLAFSIGAAKAQTNFLPEAPIAPALVPERGGPGEGIGPTGPEVSGPEAFSGPRLEAKDTTDAPGGWSLWRPDPSPQDERVTQITKGAGNALDKYQWRGLIWQSVEFNVAENGFRVSSDPVMRDTLAHRPFWHNYVASMKQFNMHRWNDGDTFIVNYVGHSMQGAVAADIEIQNSPTDARIQWGDPGYVHSRFKGFLWAIVYSTHSEISPAGEPGVGNEGGFTYGVECQYHCNGSNFKAGDHYTNDTGWVDFIATPTVGMAWVAAEDFLDKKVSNRLSERNPGRFWPKVVRSGLNPARSFANWLRWKPSWYRDFEQPLPEASRVHWFPSEEDAADRELPALQLAPYFTGFSIAANTPGCFNCRRTATGGGLQTTANIRGWLSFDGAVSFHPNASPLPSDRAGGNMLVAVFGLSATRQWRYYAAHLAVRPGLVRFSNAYVTSPQTSVVASYPPGIATSGGEPSPPGPGVIDATGTPEEPKLGDINHFAWDVNLGLDYRLTKKLAFRFGVDETVVRYRTDKVDPPGVGTPPYLSWLSRQQFLNRGNYSLQIGPVFSF